jgi:histidinol-phosphate aminotransferase
MDYNSVMNDETRNINNKLSDMVLGHYRNVKSYESVKTPVLSDPSTHNDNDAMIKLDANENPFGVTKVVKNVLSDAVGTSIYPDPDQYKLRQSLSDYTGVAHDQIVAGAGSDELIDLIARLFVGPGDIVLSCGPTFGMYAFTASVLGAKILNIPRKDDTYELDIPAILEVISKVKLVYLASPNNPTGNLVDFEEIYPILQTGTPVVIDEAYYEFSGVSLAGLLKDFPNLMILRTFSKWAGLAGLRVGYGLFPLDIANILMRVKSPYSVGTLAQSAAIASLDNKNEYAEQIAIIKNQRDLMYEKLSLIPSIKTHRSNANFLFLKIMNGKAKKVHAKLFKSGISVRYFNQEELKNFIRISIGMPDQNEAVLAVLTDRFIEEA